MHTPFVIVGVPPSGKEEIGEVFEVMICKLSFTNQSSDYKHTGQDRQIQKEMASTHTKNATKPNSSKILQLQTARKKINWTT